MDASVLAFFALLLILYVSGMLEGRSPSTYKAVSRSIVLFIATLPLPSAIALSVKVTLVPSPSHLAILLPVPDPVNTEELSIFCQTRTFPEITAIAQSPTSQSVIPLKLVLPATETI